MTCQAEQRQAYATTDSLPPKGRQGESVKRESQQHRKTNCTMYAGTDIAH